MSNNTNPHWGSTLEDFLQEEGIHQTARTTAIMRVVAWQLAQAMEQKGISKTELAEQMHTSRAQLDRLLKAKGNVTLETLLRAAELVGRELHVELQ